ncbi:unnamed protein product [Sphagnum troendelagicum]|uniref:Uncharacterized protein n=1 Tax=Sphagnum troendelagicum TaxID=128251 RepID=A0ABP0TCX4_9BRYO
MYFARLSLLVLNVFDHSVHDLAFLKRIDDLLVECPLPLPNCVVASQVCQVYVASAICNGNQSTSWDGRVSRVVNRQDDVATADVVTFWDDHDRIIAHMGAMLVWHNQVERKFVSDPRLQVNRIHRDIEKLFDDRVRAVMVNHELAIVRTNVFIGKVVVAN